jgi:hypothetical protein
MRRLLFYKRIYGSAKNCGRAGKTEYNNVCHKDDFVIYFTLLSLLEEDNTGFYPHEAKL